MHSNFEWVVFGAFNCVEIWWGSSLLVLVLFGNFEEVGFFLSEDSSTIVVDFFLVVSVWESSQ